MNRAQAVDALMDQADELLSGCSWLTRDPEEEAAMDLLADREEFIDLVEEAAQSLLLRPSHGPGDVEFEAVMVELMGAVQSRLRARRRRAVRR